MISFLPSPDSDSSSGFRLAHISDPHLTNLEDVSWRELCNKRLLGYLSWKLKRRHIHKLEVLNKLIQHISQNNVHHLLISGDLTHIGTAGEYDQASAWLDNLGKPEEITVIPGNHDAYVATSAERSINKWSGYMCSDGKTNLSHDKRFPSLRVRGSTAIIGVSTAIPTAPFLATGKIGQPQLKALGNILKDCEQKKLFRIVALHHGPLRQSNKWRKRLTDAQKFREIIQENGAELILHGHGHHAVTDGLAIPDKSIPVIGVASASALSSEKDRAASYNLYDINKNNEHWVFKSSSYIYSNGSDKPELLSSSEMPIPFVATSA